MKSRRCPSLVMLGVFLSLPLFFFVSCNDDNDFKGSEYVFVNQVDSRSNISVYDHSSGRLNESIYRINSSPIFAYAAARNDEFIYLATGSFLGVLHKVNIDTGEEVKQENFWPGYVANSAYPKMDVFNNDLLFITLTDEGKAVLQTFDQELQLQDSVSLGDAHYIYEAKVINNKLFVSVSNYPTYAIFVYDLTSRSLTKTIPMTAPTFSLVAVNGNQFLAGSYIASTLISLSSFEKEGTIDVGISAPYVALDESANILYYLQPAAQPSSTPYILSKLDLSSGQVGYVTVDMRETIFPPLVYDKRAGLLVTGGGLKLFKKDGTVVYKTSAPAQTSHIFIK